MGLHHANKLLDENGSDYIDQIILIGDYPPNTPEECKYRQNYYKCWDSILPIKNSVEQVKKLQNHGVPVFSFYVDTKAKQAFEDISKKTGGTSNYLDANSDQGSTHLLHALAEKILEKVGEKENKPELVEQYRKQNNITIVK